MALALAVVFIIIFGVICAADKSNKTYRTSSYLKLGNIPELKYDSERVYRIACNIFAKYYDIYVEKYREGIEKIKKKPYLTVGKEAYGGCRTGLYTLECKNPWDMWVRWSYFPLLYGDQDSEDPKTYNNTHDRFRYMVRKEVGGDPFELCGRRVGYVCGGVTKIEDRPDTVLTEEEEHLFRDIDMEIIELTKCPEYPYGACFAYKSNNVESCLSCEGATCNFPQKVNYKDTGYASDDETWLGGDPRKQDVMPMAWYCFDMAIKEVTGSFPSKFHEYHMLISHTPDTELARYYNKCNQQAIFREYGAPYEKNILTAPKDNPIYAESLRKMFRRVCKNHFDGYPCWIEDPSGYDPNYNVDKSITG